MKISNWWRKVAATLVASGLLAPSAACAVDIPLGDPSFEDYNVTPNGGFAYANLYGNTSAWIDDPGSGFHFGGPHASNWLYDSTFAEDPNMPAGSFADKQAAPRTGNQAMHGRSTYSGQVVSDVFEAGMTYRFSIYSQGNENSLLLGPPFGWQSRVWLYIYNGSQTFSEPTSLTFARYAPSEPIPPEFTEFTEGDFLNRPMDSTQAQSQASWEQISIEWEVLEGAPEVGHPIGVAFWMGDHAAVDDASLEAFATIPPLALHIDRDDGRLRIVNNSGSPLNISGYQITSEFGALETNNWLSIAENYDAGTIGPNQVDADHDWSELTVSGVHDDMSEADLDSGLGATLADLAEIDLGTPWIRTPTEDLVFQYISDGEVKSGRVFFDDNGGVPYTPGDLNTDGAINSVDWGILRSNQQRDLSSFSLAEAYRLGDITGDGKNNHPDFAAFKAAYEAANGVGAFEAMLASVPEPATVVLVLAAGVAVLPVRRRRIADLR